MCGEIQSKRPKENVAGDSDEGEPDEKPPPTAKQMLEALRILRRGIQQRGDFHVFEQRKSYKDMITKLAEEGKIRSTPDGFLSKNQSAFSYLHIILFYF